LTYEQDAEEIRSAGENLRRLRASDGLAQGMGEGLGSGEILL
jgi:hypothetical protein